MQIVEIIMFNVNTTAHDQEDNWLPSKDILQ